ncbi:MAG: hypothetical protein U0031_15575 [Thermomicrobiales bacterium]
MSGTATGTRELVDGEWRNGEEFARDKQHDGHDLIAQASLPPLRWLMQPNECRFAHEAEVEFAKLLSFYGIRWAYEPTTFAVRWGDDGNPVEFVTPDFYLPDHDAYVELTTMRQRLVTRKNRKFRHLREHYPNVRVRMLYLRDFERLRETYRLPDGDRESRVARTVVAEAEVYQRIGEMARELIEIWQSLSREEREQRPLLMGLGPGSRRFLAALSERVRETGTPIDSCQVAVNRFTLSDDGAKARLIRQPHVNVAGRLVVIVQEVLSTGLSAAFLAAWLRRNGAANASVCALLDREAARILDVPVISRGIMAPDVALAGFGLSRWHVHRHLPYIAEVEEN